MARKRNKKKTILAPSLTLVSSENSQSKHCGDDKKDVSEKPDAASQAQSMDSGIAHNSQSSMTMDPDNPEPPDTKDAIAQMRQIIQKTLSDEQTEQMFRNAFQPLLKDYMCRLTEAFSEIIDDQKKQQERMKKLEREMEHQKVINQKLAQKVTMMEQKLDSTSEEIDNEQNKTDNVPKTHHEMSSLKNLVVNQQAVLEEMIHGNRRNNIIITGLKEEDKPEQTLEDELKSDMEKAKTVLKQIDCQHARIVKINRLGQVNNKNRPLKVTLLSAHERMNILTNSKKLRDAPENFAKIYIKKELHPSILHEQRRLRESERAERLRPENKGHDIKINWRNMCLMKDNAVIRRA